MAKYCENWLSVKVLLGCFKAMLDMCLLLENLVVLNLVAHLTKL
jgi:hypothetical protein